MSRALEKMLRRMTEPNAQFRAYADALLADPYWEYVKQLEAQSASIPSLPTLQRGARPQSILLPADGGVEMASILDVLKRHEAEEAGLALPASSPPAPPPKHEKTVQISPPRKLGRHARTASVDKENAPVEKREKVLHSRSQSQTSVSVRECECPCLDTFVLFAWRFAAATRDRDATRQAHVSPRLKHSSNG